MKAIFRLINYTGLLAFIALLVAIFAVILEFYQIHKIAGMVMVVFACLHGGLVLYKNIKIKSGRKV